MVWYGSNGAMKSPVGNWSRLGRPQISLDQAKWNCRNGKETSVDLSAPVCHLSKVLIAQQCLRSFVRAVLLEVCWREKHALGDDEDGRVKSKSVGPYGSSGIRRLLHTPT